MNFIRKYLGGLVQYPIRALFDFMMYTLVLAFAIDPISPNIVRGILVLLLFVIMDCRSYYLGLEDARPKT